MYVSKEMWSQLPYSISLQNMLSSCTAKGRSLQTSMLSERKSKLRLIELQAVTKAFPLCPSIYEYILHTVRIQKCLYLLSSLLFTMITEYKDFSVLRCLDNK